MYTFGVVAEAQTALEMAQYFSLVPAGVGAVLGPIVGPIWSRYQAVLRVVPDANERTRHLRHQISSYLRTQIAQQHGRLSSEPMEVRLKMMNIKDLFFMSRRPLILSSAEVWFGGETYSLSPEWTQAIQSEIDRSMAGMTDTQRRHWSWWLKFHQMWEEHIPYHLAVESNTKLPNLGQGLVRQGELAAPSMSPLDGSGLLAISRFPVLEITSDLSSHNKQKVYDGNGQ